MDRTEIKSFFDGFMSANKLTLCSYSYFSFFTYFLENENKQLFFFHDKDNDALFTYYYLNKKYKFSHLPLVKYKLDESNCSDYIKMVDKFARKTKMLVDIYGVPHEIAPFFRTKKLIKMDNSYIYDTNEFLKLEGINFKPIRRYYNKYEKNHKDCQIKELEQSHCNRVNELFDEWTKEARTRVFRVTDVTANRNWLSKFSFDKQFNQWSYVLLNGETIDAVINLFEPYPNADFIVINLIKAKHYVEGNDGIDEYFFTEIYKLMNAKGFKYVNYGSDLGQKGLANFKMKMRPISINTNYRIVYDYSTLANDSNKKGKMFF